MSDPVRFLTALSQTLSSVALYGDDHPVTARAQERAHQRLLELQSSTPRLEFTFLGKEVLFGEDVMAGLQGWNWNTRLSEAGIERLEFTDRVDANQFTRFLDQVAARLGLRPSMSAEAWQMGQSAIRFGQVALRDDSQAQKIEAAATILECNTDEEREAVDWINREVAERGRLPVAEADAVVRSLSITMHMQRAMMMPLLELKEYDQYTTTHAMNVAVLSMALGEFLGLTRETVRHIGMAGLLHDLGKIRIPLEILNKPGRLSPEERAVVEAHPADGARILLGGRDPARPGRPGRLRAPSHARRRRVSLPALSAERPVRQPAGARLRRVRCPADEAPLSGGVGVGTGNRLHRGAGREGVRPRNRPGVHHHAAEVGGEYRHAAGVTPPGPACRAPPAGVARSARRVPARSR